MDARTDAQIDTKLDEVFHIPLDIWMQGLGKMNFPIISTPDINCDEWKKVEIELLEKLNIKK